MRGRCSAVYSHARRSSIDLIRIPRPECSGATCLRELSVVLLAVEMFSTLEATQKVVKQADSQFNHFHAVMAKPTT